MSNQDTRRDSPRGRDSDSRSQGTKSSTAMASDAYSKVSTLAGDAAEKAKDAVAGTASTLTQHAKSLLDRQVESGAEMVEHVAKAARRAADDLNGELPQVASLVRTAADRIDEFAHELEHKSVDDLARTAAEFARRQPAVVFGLGALLGFFAFRAFKTAPRSIQSPPIAPTQHDGGRRASEVHGA